VYASALCRPRANNRHCADTRLHHKGAGGFPARTSVAYDREQYCGALVPQIAQTDESESDSETTRFTELYVAARMARTRCIACPSSECGPAPTSIASDCASSSAALGDAVAPASCTRVASPLW